MALAVLGVSIAAYVSTRGTLYGQVDQDLTGRAAATVRDLTRPMGGRGERDGPFGGPQTGRFGGPGTFPQRVDAEGRTLRLPRGETALPVNAAARGCSGRRRAILGRLG